MKTFQFSFKDLKLTSNSIETVLGYKEGEDRELVSGLIGEIFSEAEDISSIKAQYVIFDDINFEPASRSLKINDISFGINNIIYGQIRKSESIAVFLSTAGPEIGIRSRQAMHDRDLLKGYIYDVIGSEIVEAAADFMQEDLKRAMLESGYNTTNRYSPGYCGWDVTEQHSLFRLLPENFCGIRLTPSALMDPVKSASGIIGIGKDVKYNPYTCRMCSQDDCVYRRIRETAKK